MPSQIRNIILIILANIALGVVYPEKSSAQFIDRVGLELGGTHAFTDFNDYYRFYSRAYVRKDHSTNFFSEFGLGIGLIDGREYRTRLMPADLRFHYAPVRDRIIRTRRNAFIITPYAFTGLGSLGYRHINIAAPDNPLTVEMGPAQPNSGFWLFDQSWGVYVPIGLGMDFRLEERTSFTARISYQQTSSDKLAGIQATETQGYLSFTLGLNYRTQRRQPPPPPLNVGNYSHRTALPATPVQRQYPEPSLILATSQINDARFTFGRYVTTTTEYEKGILDLVAGSLRLFPEINVEVQGHTDSRGGVTLNDAVSRTRAWNVVQYFVSLGIPPFRMEPVGKGLHHPIADNNTEEGREMNRRVEFVAGIRDTSRDHEFIQPWEEIPVPRFRHNEIVMNYEHIRFTEFRSDQPSLLDTTRIYEIAAYMHYNPRSVLEIQTWSNQNKIVETQEVLGISRANVIRNQLIMTGISDDRIRVTANTVSPGAMIRDANERRRHVDRWVIARIQNREVG